MNSRERVLAALHHTTGDGVPIDLGSNPSSGISAIAYANLREYLGIQEGSTYIYDVVQQLAQPEQWALDRFGVDVIDIGRAFNTQDSDWYPITLSSGHKAHYPVWFTPELQKDGSYIAKDAQGTILARMPVGATFFDGTCFPFADQWPDSWDELDNAMGKILWSALVHSPWDHAHEEGFWDQLRAKTLQLRQETDKALMVVIGCNLFEWGTFLRRIDNFLVDLLLEPEKVEQLLDALMERHLSSLEKVCTYVGDIVDIVRFGDDLGTDTGPFMDPNTYRSLFKPRHTQLCEYAKAHSTMKTFLHSCGSIDLLIPDLIDAGFDILNPVQTSAHGMAPEHLKREYGKDMVFWGGGVDTRTVLNIGSTTEVKRQVHDRLKIFSEGGGYVFNTIHNILPDVPPENIVAMFEAVHEFNGTSKGV